MAKNDFISDNLVHMRDRLKENAAKAGGSAPVPAPGEEPEAAPKLSGRTVMRDPGPVRADDPARRKRELAEKLERDRAAAAAAIEVESGKLEELRRFEQTLAELERDCGRLGPVDTPEGARELEKLCFSHYRAAGRASVFLHTRGGAPVSPHAPEPGGMRRHCRESLPLAAALIASALIVALTLIFLFY